MIFNGENMKKAILNRIEGLDFEKDFVVDDINDKTYTYSEFFSRCKEISDYLCKRTKEQTVIAVMENSVDLAMLYFAVLFSDKSIAVIDPQKGDSEITTITDDFANSIVIIDDEKRCGILGENVILFSEMKPECDTCPKIKGDFINCLKNRASNSLYLITFTSGTSGVTKGVKHSFDNLALTAIALDEKVASGERTLLHVMPMTYMAGILNSIFYPFLIGGRIVITKRFSPMTARTFWKTVEKHNVDLFWLSPSMLMMIDKMDRGEVGEKYCREKKPIFLIGTAPLTNELRTSFNSRYGVEVFASYGLSETLFVSVETPYSLSRSDVNCVGELVNNLTYKITDSGEMYISVPWMYLGYTNVNTDEYFEGDYYKTGDLVKISDNLLYVTGRSKDLIIKGGMNISPLLIENVVLEIDAVQETAVIGVKDSMGEERILCTYALKDNKNEQGLDTQIKKHVIDKLGKNYTLDYTWRVDSLPRNINGKIDKHSIIDIWKEKTKL